MVSWRLLLAGLVVVLVLGLFLAYLFLYRPGVETTTQRPGVKLLIVTRLAPEEGDALKRRFLASSIARDYGIVDVEFRKEDVSKWPLYSTGGLGDLFFIGGYAVYKDLCERGLLAPIDDAEVLRVAESIGAYIHRGPDGRVCFIAVSRTIFSYTVNSKFLDKYGLQVPESWDDLAKPEFSKPLLSGEALISFPKPSKSTTAARTLQLILQKYGWELGWVILTMMGANSYIVESSEKARDDVALGITGLAPTVLVYGIRAEIESGGNAKFIAAKNGVLPDISPVALAKDTRNKEAALAFIKWLLSPEGQRALAELFYYLPYIKPEDTLLGRIYEDVSSNIFNYDPEEASRWERSVIYYFEAAIADPDTNTLLKKVWVKALELYSRGLLSRDDLLRIQGELGKPLTLRIIVETRDFTREYAIEINKSIAEDTLFRDKFMDSIKRAAIERYNSILRELERIG